MLIIPNKTEKLNNNKNHLNVIIFKVIYLKIYFCYFKKEKERKKNRSYFSPLGKYNKIYFSLFYF